MYQVYVGISDDDCHYYEQEVVLAINHFITSK